MRRSRHQRPLKPDYDIRATPRSLETLRLFDRYRILPLNWMHALVDPESSYDAYRHLVKRMWAVGLLDRKTLNGQKNNNECMNYMRSPAGDRFLHDKGFEALHHDTHHDTHQALVDLAEAQIELGARNSSLEYHPWLKVRDHPLTPSLPDKPFRFDVNGTYQIPDGRPFYLKSSNGSTLFLREIDRNTEAPNTIAVKLQNYLRIHNQIKQRYGFKSVMLLFITTTATREQNILKWVKKEFPEGCTWIITQTMTDHIKECLSTTPVTTHLFDSLYNRAGYSQYSLKTLGDA